MIDRLEIIKAYPLAQDAYELQAYRRTLEDFLNSHGLTISIEPVAFKSHLCFVAKIFYLRESYIKLGYSTHAFNEYWDESPFNYAINYLKLFETYDESYEKALGKAFEIIEEELKNIKETK